MSNTTKTARRQLRELDDQIRRCRDEIAATDPGAADGRRTEQNLVLGTLTARRIVTLQWL